MSAKRSPAASRARVRSSLAASAATSAWMAGHSAAGTTATPSPSAITWSPEATRTPPTTTGRPTVTTTALAACPGAVPVHQAGQPLVRRVGGHQLAEHGTPGAARAVADQHGTGLRLVERRVHGQVVLGGTGAGQGGPTQVRAARVGGQPGRHPYPVPAYLGHPG